MGLIRLIIIVSVAYFLARLVRGALANLGQTTARPYPHGPGSAGPSSAGHNSTKNAYEVLDIPSGASQQEIHAAYQRMVRQYHPDRVADMGPELRHIAEERTKEINEAYARLRRR